jgi:hypothetical protein
MDVQETTPEARYIRARGLRIADRSTRREPTAGLYAILIVLYAPSLRGVSANARPADAAAFAWAWHAGAAGPSFAARLALALADLREIWPRRHEAARRHARHPPPAVPWGRDDPASPATRRSIAPSCRPRARAFATAP